MKLIHTFVCAGLLPVMMSAHAEIVMMDDDHAATKSLATPIAAVKGKTAVMPAAIAPATPPYKETAALATPMSDKAAPVLVVTAPGKDIIGAISAESKTEAAAPVAAVPGKDVSGPVQPNKEAAAPTLGADSALIAAARGKAAAVPGVPRKGVSGAALPNNEAEAPTPATPRKDGTVWVLVAGRPIGHELRGWGAKAGWKIVWDMQKDWIVPADSQFTGDFPAAAADVINTLASNGALIHARFYEGNKTIVVTGAGASE